MFRSSIFLLFLVFATSNVDSKSSLTILHAPKGILFRSNHPLPVSQLKDVFETVLSYTVEAGYDWRGLDITNPFTASAECLLIFHVPGSNVLNFPYKTTLSLEGDGEILDVFSDVAKDTELRYPGVDKSVLEATIGSSNVVVRGSPDWQFKVTKYPLEKINDRISNLKNIINQMLVKRNKDGAPDIFWITLAGISQQPLNPESMELLEFTLNDISEKVSAMYKEKAFVAVISDDLESKIRSKRDTSSSNTTTADLNIADDYSEDFPVIFNIILWFSLALLFSLIAISMVIAGMDPGRDSIIYRMTSTRMKKDN